MNRFLRRAHLLLYTVSVLLSFVIFYPFLYYFTRTPTRYSTLNHFRYLFASVPSLLSGIFYRFRFEKPVDWSKTYIVCANHSSNLDPAVLSSLIKTKFAFLGKDDLLDNPVTSLFFKTIDIPVNRDSKIASFRAFKRAGEYLEQGISLAIFPEGKIGDDYPPVMHEFKNGPFRLAIEKKVPIIPVTIIDAWKKMWDDGRKYGSSPGICHICVHAPMETAQMDLSEGDDLRDKVYSIIQAELKKYES